MRRIVLLFMVVTLVTTMVFITAVSGIAKEDPPTDEAPFRDATDEPSFSEDDPPFYEDDPPFYEDTAEEPLIEEGSVQEVPLCAPGWLQYCYTDENGWYRMYHG